MLGIFWICACLVTAQVSLSAVAEDTEHGAWRDAVARATFADSKLVPDSVRVLDEAPISKDISALLVKGDGDTDWDGYAHLIWIAVAKRDATTPLFVIKDTGAAQYERGPTSRIERATPDVITIEIEEIDWKTLPDKRNFFIDLTQRREIQRLDYEPFSFADAVVRDDTLYCLMGRRHVVAGRLSAGGGIPDFRVVAAEPWPDLPENAKPDVELCSHGFRVGMISGKWYRLPDAPTVSSVAVPLANLPGHPTIELPQGESAALGFEMRYGESREYYPLQLPPSDAIAKMKSDWWREAQAQDSIDGAQVIGDKVLFGLTFYNGEGYTGIGGLGWFHLKRHTYDMVYAAELVNFSNYHVTQTKNYVWSALTNDPEGVSSSGGLARYDLKSKSVKVYPVPSVINRICVVGRDVYCATEDGIYLVQRTGITEYRGTIDQDGKPYVWHRPFVPEKQPAK